MSTESAREVIGNGDRGEVCIITKQVNNPGGQGTHTEYIVRMGAFTVHETASKANAVSTARALCR